MVKINRFLFVILISFIFFEQLSQPFFIIIVITNFYCLQIDSKHWFTVFIIGFDGMCSCRLIRLSSHAYEDHTPKNPYFRSYPSSIKHLKSQGQKGILETVCTPTLKSV